MRIGFFGESFVNGTGDPECLGWVGRVCAAAIKAGHDLTCYNLGIRRETSDELRRRWRAEADLRLLPEHDPRLVFSFGVNDTIAEGDGTRIVPHASLANARAILTEAAARCPVLMVGPPPLPDDEQSGRIATLSAAFAGMCAELGVPYLETCAPLLATPVWCAEAAAGDGAHPGAAGYAELALLVTAWPAWQAWFTDERAPESRATR
jgi:lysophospholipase L1-like esterase